MGDAENKGQRNADKIKSPYILQSTDKYLRHSSRISQLLEH